MTRAGRATTTSPPAPSPPHRAGSFRAFATPRRLLVPLAGVAPADVAPLAEGTAVAAGEPLIRAVPQAAPVPLAPVAGVVNGVGRAALADGRVVPAIVLGTGSAVCGVGEEAHVPSAPDLATALQGIHGSKLGEWIDRLRKAGVWADRWGSPDLLAQLNQCLWRPVDTLICSALDLDAALPVQATIVRERGPDLYAGVALLAKLTGATSVWVVVDTAAGAAVPPSLAGRGEAVGVRLVPVENEYPRAHPSILLHALARRKLPFGQLPTTHGVLLLDAAAAAMTGAQFLRGASALTAPLALHAGLQGVHLLEAPIGCAFRDALAAVNVAPDRATLRTGSPLRDVRVPPEAVVSAGGELTLFVGPSEEDAPPADPCIRCSWCVEGCPVHIQPAALLEASQRDDPEMAERYGIHACIECGICSYVCPSRLPLLQGIRVMRGRDS
jgi:electron transport complex protein RnfC